MHQPPKGSTALVVMILLAGVVVGAANAAILLLAMRASPDVSLFEGSYRLSPVAVGYSIFAPLAVCALIAFLVRNLAPAALKTPATTPAPPGPPSPVPALRLLALLQQEGRLVDFLKEDIDGYSDAQVGAAVRSIHAGCRKALSDRIELQRIFSAEDGSEVVVEAGFDPATIRLTGNVTGKPPFRGTLQHAGWRAANVSLPQSPGDTDATIIAPAEVEVP